MALTTEHIISTIKKEEAYIKSRYFITHIEIFGSYAKQQQHTDSDIDINLEIR